ncbi:MAG: hypothetical protein Q8L64_00490 [bacterium]|nr:hypothetical protein [bacterium]
MAVVIFHGKATFVSGGISFSPLGDTGEGFRAVKFLSCQSKTSSQVKPSPKKNFNATPSAFGTSPKYDDDSKFESSYLGEDGWGQLWE